MLISLLKANNYLKYQINTLQNIQNKFDTFFSKFQ